MASRICGLFAAISALVALACQSPLWMCPSLAFMMATVAIVELQYKAAAKRAREQQQANAVRTVLESFSMEG